MQDLLDLYSQRKDEIKSRLHDFKELWNREDKRIFAELCFCLCTPQSRAESCWKAVKQLMGSGVLYKGRPKDIEGFLTNVRFPENKAKYIFEARRLFTENGEIRIKDKIKPESIKKTGDWFLKNVKGLGLKEVNHFLRNIGFGDNLAILDRHILKNLVKYRIIEEIPKNLTPKRYFEMEKRMKQFSERVGIPLGELDLLFWSKETGRIFK